MNQYTAKLGGFLTLTITALGSFLVLSCAPKMATTLSSAGAGDTAIMGGHPQDISFEKKNGVVGLLLVMEKLDSNGQPKQSQAICTGSLISKRLVLTAAHCVRDKALKGILVTFGTNIKNSIDQKSYIVSATVVPNPGFMPAGSGGSFVEGQPWNDIGLVLLRSDAPADFALAKLPAAKDMYSLTHGARLTLAGFGVTNPIVNEVKEVNGREVVSPIKSGEPSTAGTLRSVEHMPVGTVTRDGKEILVDQTGERGACHGDSGGPAYIENADGSLSLIGVTSRGTNLNGNCDRQNVFTNVYGHLDWINQVMQKVANLPSK